VLSRAASIIALLLVLLGCPPVWAGPTESLQEFFAAINVEAAKQLAARITGGGVVPSTSGRLFLVRVGPLVERAQASEKLHELLAVGNHPFIAEARD